jgi:hypothetical protein
MPAQIKIQVSEQPVMEYKTKGYEGGTGGRPAKRPLKRRPLAAKPKPKPEPMNGLLVLSTKAFARFEECMTNPGQPTEANYRGAQLLRTLYSKSR